MYRRRFFGMLVAAIVAPFLPWVRPIEWKPRRMGVITYTDDRLREHYLRTAVYRLKYSRPGIHCYSLFDGDGMVNMRVDVALDRGRYVVRGWSTPWPSSLLFPVPQ